MRDDRHLTHLHRTHGQWPLARHGRVACSCQSGDRIRGGGGESSCCSYGRALPRYGPSGRRKRLPACQCGHLLLHWLRLLLFETEAAEQRYRHRHWYDTSGHDAYSAATAANDPNLQPCIDRRYDLTASARHDTAAILFWMPSLLRTGHLRVLGREEGPRKAWAWCTEGM